MSQPYWPPMSLEKSAPPIDRAFLAEYTGGDPGRELQLLDRFRHALEIDFAHLETALGADDAPEALAILHRMKGAGAAIGAVPFADACVHLEQSGGRDDLGGVLAGLQVLRAEVDRVAAFIAQLRLEREA
jgi:HPt (histidine-containing phosphotransfer) domain-containing protein